MPQKVAVCSLLEPALSHELPVMPPSSFCLPCHLPHSAERQVVPLQSVIPGGIGWEKATVQVRRNRLSRGRCNCGPAARLPPSALPRQGTPSVGSSLAGAVACLQTKQQTRLLVCCVRLQVPTDAHVLDLAFLDSRDKHVSCKLAANSFTLCANHMSAACSPTCNAGNQSV